MPVTAIEAGRSMSEIFGAFRELAEDAEGEGLTLRFSPSSVPLKQRWRNNGLSADFLADYVQTFLPSDDSDPATRRRQLTIKGAVNFIANELLENAMKYSASGNVAAITMRVLLTRDHILFHQSNSASAVDAEGLHHFVSRLESIGPEEMYLQQIEQGGDGSGLGLLTMINDYGARLAFRFDKEDNAGSSDVRVTTQVELDL